MTTYRAERRVLNGSIITQLCHPDIFGRWVPLLDQHGKPVNFEGKPTALDRAALALAVMDKLWGRGA